MRNRDHFRDWFLSPVLHELREVGLSLYAFRQELRTLMGDTTEAKKALDALNDNVNNVVIPLLQKLANVPADDQAAIDALRDEATAILGNLTGAEPAPPTPPVAPPTA